MVCSTFGIHLIDNPMTLHSEKLANHNSIGVENANDLKREVA
jgi:hypothetical protein